MAFIKALTVYCILIRCLHAQEPQVPIHVQNNTFNSSYVLSPAQIKNANLSEIEVNNVEIALNFERSNWASGSTGEDPFYQAPPINSSTPPGTLLRTQEFTNTTTYTLAPNLALSRIVFASADLNGSTVPASAYVLWPWQAKSFEGSSLNVSGVPVIGWAHGTSGVFGECGPSHIRNLWYQFSAPYILALQGYAVIAPDYAGLGVNSTADGKPVLHQYLANPAHANDLFYAVEAAQRAFPELSEQFVAMGHSQGGGAAWAAAQRQAKKPVNGYLGTVAGSPVTDILDMINVFPALQYALAMPIAHGIPSIFPDFQLSDWLEPAGVRRFRLIQELQGCNSVTGEVLAASEGLVKPDLQTNTYLQAFRNLTYNGRLPISGPMLVLQGTEDTLVPNITSTVVNETCAMYPDSRINYAEFEGVTHVPVLDASQQIWLKWIEDRFMGKTVESGCKWDYRRPLRSAESYQKELAYYQMIALEGYTVA